MRTTTLWLAGLLTIGFLATLWPLPTTIAHETVEVARSQGTVLADDAAMQLADSVASDLWPWWIANLVVMVLGAKFVILAIKAPRPKLANWLLAFLLAGAALTWCAVLASSHGLTFFVWQYELGIRFFEKGSLREAFVIFHRLIGLTFFTLGLVVYIAFRTRRKALFERG